MQNKNVNRRDFLRSGMYAAAGLAGCSLIAEVAIAAKTDGTGFRVLTRSQANLLEAISARLIPTTDTPGAREAGVVYFYDIALSDRMADLREPLLAGVGEFDDSVRRTHGRPFAALTEERQDASLRAHQDDPFFEILRKLTMLGFFAMAKHGGNRDHVSWTLIGFGGHGAAQYPFGFYDAEAAGQTTDG